MKNKFEFYSDPSHGWLKVPKTLLIVLGIADKITGYSYMRGEYAYLEEDSDASTFSTAWESKTGKKFDQLNENRHNSDKASKIRGYDSYARSNTFNDFKRSIKIKDVEDNKTYVYTTFEGCKYGQSYQNQTHTIEDMINSFIVFYYPMVLERAEEVASNDQ
jgi:hypothetical protein